MRLRRGVGGISGARRRGGGAERGRLRLQALCKIHEHCNKYLARPATSEEVRRIEDANARSPHLGLLFRIWDSAVDVHDSLQFWAMVLLSLCCISGSGSGSGSVAGSGSGSEYRRLQNPKRNPHSYEVLEPFFDRSCGGPLDGWDQVRFSVGVRVRVLRMRIRVRVKVRIKVRI